MRVLIAQASEIRIVASRHADRLSSISVRLVGLIRYARFVHVVPGVAERMPVVVRVDATIDRLAIISACLCLSHKKRKYANEK